MKTLRVVTVLASLLLMTGCTTAQAIQETPSPTFSSAGKEVITETKKAAKTIRNLQSRLIHKEHRKVILYRKDIQIRCQSLSQNRSRYRNQRQYLSRLPSRNLLQHLSQLLHRHRRRPAREERIRAWDAMSSWIRTIIMRPSPATVKPCPKASTTWMRSCISVISRSPAIPYRRFTGMIIPLPTTDSIFGQMDL